MVGYRGPLIDPVTLGPALGCENCRHFDPQGLPRCAAFPGGIPLPILGGDVAHDRPLPGDHGIQFAPIEWPEEELERAASGAIRELTGDQRPASCTPPKAGWGLKRARGDDVARTPEAYHPKQATMQPPNRQ
ncbi:MAG: hypothetical protein ACRDJW_04415 [Thermomicrobiales bacterium]